MRAEILAIGSELLRPPRVETNAAHITGKLLEIGIEVGARVTVSDDAALLASALGAALARADVVIATGGLGPTEDDLTREAAAQALGRRLVRDPAYVEELRARFAHFGRSMPSVNEKQGDFLEGAVPLKNPRGTAPGQWVEAGERVLVLLPGPPREMEPMLLEQVLPRLRARGSGRVRRTRILKIAAMGESDVEERIAAWYKGFSNPTTTILGGPGQVELQLTAEGGSEREVEEKIEALAVGLRERLPGRIFSEDGRELHEVVAALLVERKLTLALAESCTGGLLAARLTEVPGSSAFLERGYVAYSNRAKSQAVGVDAALIERHGAVSEEVARALAEGARSAAEADIGVGITGIAGPDGGSAEKPVGLVFVGVDGAAGSSVRRAHFVGDRERVRFQATQSALEMLRRGLLGLAPH